MNISDRPPGHLSAAAKALWRRLLDDYHLDDAGGRLLLASACEAFDRLHQARRILRREGPVIRDRWNQPKPHPACGVERDARNQMHAALRLLKLEPGVMD